MTLVHKAYNYVHGRRIVHQELSHRHFRLDAVKSKGAQKVLQAGTETEAIERALDLVISEYERNRLAAEANKRFVKSGITVKDVHGTLES